MGVHLRKLPSVRREQQMDDMIVQLRLRLEVCIDHLANGGRTICSCNVGITRMVDTSTVVSEGLLTGKLDEFGRDFGL